MMLMLIVPIPTGPTNALVNLDIMETEGIAKVKIFGIL